MKRTWKIVLKGHTGVVNIDLPVEDHEAGAFIGSITSAEYGITPIKNGNYDPETATFAGDVAMGGHLARFSATMDAQQNIHGFVKVGWFFSADFVGTKV